MCEHRWDIADQAVQDVLQRTDLLAPVSYTHLAEGCADRSVLIAREQTAGRGRNGRVFHSAKDRGLYLSILLKQEQSITQLNKVTALSALALQRAVAESCGLLTQIKWVNDLYCRG